MSRLDKIIYCADILEETRYFASSVNDLRELAFIDIDKCFVLTLERQINFLKQENQNIDDNILKVYNFYKKEEING